VAVFGGETVPTEFVETLDEVSQWRPSQFVDE
jgi:hypothetical protein